MGTQKKRALLIELDQKTDNLLRIIAINELSSFRDWLSQKAEWLLEIEAEKAPGEGQKVGRQTGRRDIAVTLEIGEGYLFIAEKKAAEQKMTRNEYVSGLLSQYARAEMWGVI